MSNIISNPTLDVSNILSTSGVAYVTATPTWNPDLTPKDAKIAINQETSAVWLWDTNKVGAGDGAWVLYGLVASQAAAGSPSYTPTNASEIVVDGAGVVWAYNPLTSLWRTPTSTDLSVTTRTGTNFTLESSDGIDVVIPASSATEAGLFTAANHVALAAAIVDVADLVTLTGVAANEPDLGTFTGTTIADDLAIKPALQALETALEALIPAVASMYNSDALAAAGGIALNKMYWADSAHEEGAVHGTLKLRTV